MANYANLLAQIAANIYSNNNQEITGDVLQLQLNAMVASLGAGYQFMGVAGLNTNPGAPDQKVFYISGESGTFPNFDGLVNTDGNICILKYDSAWTISKISIYDVYSTIITRESVNKLDVTSEVLADGKFISSTGAIFSHDELCISAYIPIKEGQTLILSHGDAFGGGARGALYDDKKNFISSFSTGGSGEISVTGTSASKWVRFSLTKALLPSLMVYESNPGEYVPFGITEKDVAYIKNANSSQKIWEQIDCPIESDLEEIQTTFISNTIFDASVSGFSTTDYIPLDRDSHQSYYWKARSNFAAQYKKLEFYDKDYNPIVSVNGLTSNIPYNKVAKLVIPVFAKYVKYATWGTEIELYRAPVRSFEEVVNELIVGQVYTNTRNILWLGTSIPAGAQYPAKSCENNGYTCINKAVGGSQLAFSNTHPQSVTESSGRCLTATVAELEALYRQDVTDGVIPESWLTGWKNGSYENSVIPYIDGTNPSQVSMIVLDHGFNDRINIHNLLQNEGAIDWTSTDRSNFVGAWNYLLEKITAINPFIKIVIGGYFQNEYDAYYSADVCRMQELVAERWELPLFAVWKESGFSAQYVPGSSNYIAEYNSTYGTSYTKMNPDAAGNIMFLQLFCPDKVHPHSDLTGNANIRLNGIYTKMLSKIL